jgi:hypothetical protein
LCSLTAGPGGISRAAATRWQQPAWLWRLTILFAKPQPDQIAPFMQLVDAALEHKRAAVAAAAAAADTTAAAAKPSGTA